MNSPTVVGLAAAAVVVALISTSGCEPSSQISTQATTPSSDGAQSLGVCEWYQEALLVRVYRIGRQSDYVRWRREYSGDDWASLNLAALDELVLILKDYRVDQEEFLNAWTELGPHPEGQEFWAKESEAVDMRHLAFGEMIQGIETRDWALTDHGSELFRQSQPIGREGEKAARRIADGCGY